jgi:hypothetical protein
MNMSEASDFLTGSPNEILAKIARYRQRDTRAIRSGCLISHVVVPIYRKVLHTRIATRPETNCAPDRIIEHILSFALADFLVIRYKSR